MALGAKGIHQSSSESWAKGMAGRFKPGHDGWEGCSRQTLIKIPAFPCLFAPLGLEPRHVRSPRTPGGLLRR